ncbi:hypothetical protein EON65_41460, partial [archaeon]
MYKYSGEDVSIRHYVDTHLCLPDTHTHLVDTWIGAEFGGSLHTLGMASMGVSENMWKCGEKDFILCNPYLPSLIQALGIHTILPAIQYDKVVCGVEYGGYDGCMVRCRDGSVYGCKHVVVTIPLSILKLSVPSSPPSP